MQCADTIIRDALILNTFLCAMENLFAKTYNYVDKTFNTLEICAQEKQKNIQNKLIVKFPCVMTYITRNNCKFLIR